jgi:hypothetical protein
MGATAAALPATPTVAAFAIVDSIDTKSFAVRPESGFALVDLPMKFI